MLKVMGQNLSEHHKLEGGIVKRKLELNTWYMVTKQKKLSWL